MATTSKAQRASSAMTQHPDYNEVLHDLGQVVQDTTRALRMLAYRLNGSTSPSHAYHELNRDLESIQGSLDRLKKHYKEAPTKEGRLDR